MEIKERILLILKNHQLSPSSFADKIGVQRSNISHILSGRNKPSLDLLEKIVLHFPRVNAHWLITGKTPIVDNEPIQLTREKVEIRTKANVSYLKKVVKIIECYEDDTFKIYKLNEE